MEKAILKSDKHTFKKENIFQAFKLVLFFSKPETEVKKNKKGVFHEWTRINIRKTSPRKMKIAFDCLKTMLFTLAECLFRCVIELGRGVRSCHILVATKITKEIQNHFFQVFID